MSAIAVRVEGLGKRYKLGALDPYKTLRDQLAQLHLLARRDGGARVAPKELWALRDVSFELHQGEVLGIIGRNGAGKSTLLKILSRITRPTAGRAEIHGRVGALLEVGTGFHPELTGRENIFMSGSILGMGRVDIQQRFDEIVEFAGVEDFLDTPVKRYSSGMRVRLGFAVAAHLEPEILVIDEVLAVGDAAFQKKCLGRMSNVATEGRTVLFVSHQMETILGLCPHTMRLHNGTIADMGPTRDVVETYLADSVGDAEAGGALLDRPRPRGTDTRLRMTRIDFVQEGGRNAAMLMCGEPAVIRVHYEAYERIPADVEIAVYFKDQMGRRLICLFSKLTGDILSLSSQCGFFQCTIDKMPLAAGLYWLDVSVAAAGVNLDKVNDAIGVEVVSGDFFGTGQKLKRAGIFYVDHSWSVHSSQTDDS